MRDFKRWAVERDPSLAPDFGDTGAPDYRTLASRLAAALRECAPSLKTHEATCRIVTEFRGYPPSWDVCDCGTWPFHALLAEARAAGLLEERR